MEPNPGLPAASDWHVDSPGDLQPIPLTIFVWEGAGGVPGILGQHITPDGQPPPDCPVPSERHGWTLRVTSQHPGIGRYLPPIYLFVDWGGPVPTDDLPYYNESFMGLAIAFVMQTRWFEMEEVRPL